MLRLLKLATDGIFAFPSFQFVLLLSWGAAAYRWLLNIRFYALYYRFFLQQSPQGFTALLAAVTFLSGVLLFFLGVIGEYVGRIYEETKARPIYVVERIAGTGPGENPAATRPNDSQNARYSASFVTSADTFPWKPDRR